MRFPVALLFASAASAAFVSRASVPQCAIACIQTANLDGCSSSDDVCLCSNAAFVNSTTSCIESTCSGSDLAAAEAFAQENCGAVGITLSSSSPTSVPSSGSATSSSAASTVTSTSAASSTSSTSGAGATNIPLLAVAALGFAAFAL
ncbi:hypothetical protein EW145_g4218 [Phellinidium pouzarii]|uniref:CFEM domain-containing protein n=1 Tax=Phellinidium pouzarii TaxID=167371 RepID=A0A4S4L4C5_9AGAM|nr:hypothetical protein EW145_g4218 [Phellinidium pouzarii]